ncbi:MAG: RidA family protein [Synergistaceae bacterium]|jgi:2-iminobutanoate/2-iminopropanoate deaminase|nr:RidA family protein [Synergistaceae bacterium]
MKKIISTTKAPAAVGPYSQAVKAGNFIFTSGQLPMVAETGAFVEGGIEAQAEQVLKNVKAVLEAEGYSMADIIKATVFSTDMGDFAAVNGVYAKFFDKEPPARSFVEVSALPRGARVEIEVVAWKE